MRLRDLIFRRKRVVVLVRHSGLDLQWTMQDAEQLDAFMESDTGKKLAVAIDDKLIEAATGDYPRHFILGAKFLSVFINSLRPTKAEGGDDAKQSASAIQEDIFAHPGARYRE